MEFPAYTDDAYWTDVIEQYIQNDNNHPGGITSNTTCGSILRIA